MMSTINLLKLRNLFAIFAYFTAALLVVILFPIKVFAKTENLALLQVFKPVSFGTDTIKIGDQEEVDPDALKAERIKRLDEYFSKHDMPLEGYGDAFVSAAEKCDIDWRLLPAISVRESSGGKHMINNNPFGWGSGRIKFSSFREAIDAVGENLCGLNPTTSRYYKDKTTYERLWRYNGTVLPSYPKEVMDIMDMI